MRTNRFKSGLFGASVLAALSPAGLVHAQSGAADSTQVDEVIVTATRRSESLQDVPLSITAFSQQALDKQGVTDVGNLARISPGVSLQRRGTTGSNLSIRGIASSVGAGTTGIYIDDTPVQVRLTGASQTAASTYPVIFDLERVEILRGPQGTLFGAGSEGGTIRFISPEPSLTSRSVFARVEGSTTKGGGASYEVGAAVGGPIVDDKLGFRVSAYYEHVGGYVDQVQFSPAGVNDKNINSRNSVVVRGALKFAPTDNLNLVASIYRQDVRANSGDRVWTALSDADDGVFRNGDPMKSPSRDVYTIYSLAADLDLGGVKAVSNTSYFDRENPLLVDYSVFIPDLIGGNRSPQSLAAGVKVGSATRNAQEVFTQELRFQSDNDSKLQWVVGGFFQRAQQLSIQTLYDPQIDTYSRIIFGAPANVIFGEGLLPGGRSYRGFDKTIDQQTAIFGQLDYEVVPGWTLTAGARYSKTEFRFSNSQIGPLNAGTSGGSDSASEKPLTPKVGVRFEPNDDVTWYANAAKGFRPGGGNVPVLVSRCGPDLAALNLTTIPTTYKSDTVWSYETGVKARAFDRRIQFEGSLFYIDWKNIQSLLYLSNCGFNFTTNLANAVSKGFDARVTARPVDGLTVDLSVAYTDAYYSERVESSPNAAGVRPILVEKGDPLPTAPWFLSAAVDYERPLEQWDGATGFVRADYTFRSGIKGATPGTFAYDAAVAGVGHNDQMTARLGVRRGGLEVALFAENLLNSTDRLLRFRYTSTSPTFYDFYSTPRTVGVSLVYRN